MLVLLFGYENITRKVKNVVIVILRPKPSLNKLQFTRNPAIDMAADRVDAPCRNVEADSAAPWPRAPPLDHVKVLLCVRLGMSRDRRCGNHAAETPLRAYTAIRVRKYHSGE